MALRFFTMSELKKTGQTEISYFQILAAIIDIGLIVSGVMLPFLSPATQLALGIAARIARASEKKGFAEAAAAEITRLGMAEDIVVRNSAAVQAGLKEEFGKLDD